MKVGFAGRDPRRRREIRAAHSRRYVAFSPHHSGNRLRWRDGPAAGTLAIVSGWWVYILGCSDRTLYTGISNDLEARLAAHREGSGSKYTRARRPVRLLYREPHPDRSSAAKRESAIKKLSRSEKLALIRSSRSERLAAQPAHRLGEDLGRPHGLLERHPALAKPANRMVRGK